MTATDQRSEALRLALAALKELVAQNETSLFALQVDARAMKNARSAINTLKVELRRLAEENERLKAQAEWLPIETAPKGKDLLLLCPKRGPVRGRWEDDQYAKKPRPYWTNDRERIWGILETRSDQPTHWMPLPAAPSTPPMEPGKKEKS